MKPLPLYLVFLVTGLASCSGLKVVQDHDGTINFNLYRTYNFTPAADSIPVSQLNKKRLFNDISGEMHDSDIRWAADPDLYVHVQLLMKGSPKTIVTYGRGASCDLGSGISGSPVDYSEFSEGSLFFDIIDAKRNQLVWTSKVDGAIKSPDILTEKDIDRIVKKAFRNFPPG